ncbi:MAG: lysozyme inhibitor LprI family protein [Cyanobacteria bacterium J06648_16]
MRWIWSLVGMGVAIVTVPGAIAAERPAAGNTDQPIPGVVQPYCLDRGQISLNRCAANWARLTERLHAAIKAEIDSGLSPDQPDQLAEIEADWIAFRDAHCSLVAQQVEGGSLYPMVFNQCIARITNERIAALQAWGVVPDDWDGAEMALQTAYAEFETAYASPDPLLELTQTHWETYRVNHCQFEAARQDAVLGDEQRCLARLAVERTAQLRWLTGFGW